MAFKWNPITNNLDLVDEPPSGIGDVFHADPLTDGKIVVGAGTDFIRVTGIDVDVSNNITNANTLSVVDISTTQQNLDLEPGVDVQVWNANLDEFALLSPISGDIIYGDGTPEWKKLPKGLDGKILKLVTGFPSWEDDSTGGDVFGPVSAVNTNLASFDGITGKLIADSGIPFGTVLVDGDIGVTVQAYSANLDEFAALTPVSGDIIYSDGTPDWAKLPKAVDGKLLKLVGGFPSWEDDSTGGDVFGPGSSTSGNIANFGDGTGKLISDSGIPSSTVLVDGDIGVTVQAYSANLDNFSGLTPVTGDMIFSDGSPSWVKLPKSTDGKVLKLVSGFPSWQDALIYTDHGIGATVLGDSGSFSTAAITLTLPASPTQGQRCEFISTSGVLVIQANTGQVIHVAGDLTSVGGQVTGSATGDSLSLIYQSSSDDWWNLGSPSGVWVLT